MNYKNKIKKQTGLTTPKTVTHKLDTTGPCLPLLDIFEYFLFSYFPIKGVQSGSALERNTVFERHISFYIDSFANMVHKYYIFILWFPANKPDSFTEFHQHTHQPMHTWLPKLYKRNYMVLWIKPQCKNGYTHPQNIQKTLRDRCFRHTLI